MIIHTQMYSIFSLLAKNAYIYIYRCKFKCIAIILDNKDNGKCKTCNIMKMFRCTWKYFRLTVQYFRPEIVTSVKVFFQKQTKLPCLCFFFHVWLMSWYHYIWQVFHLASSAHFHYTFWTSQLHFLLSPAGIHDSWWTPWPITWLVNILTTSLSMLSVGCIELHTPDHH